MNKKESEFNKVFSAWDILVIAFGAMIGWGWVVSTGSWIEKGGVLGAALGFALGGVMIFFVGLTYAELTAAMPQCGGEHVFSHRAMGATGSFICTWAIVLGYVSVACFEACAFPTIITYLWPGFLKGYLYTVAGFDVYASWLAVAIIVAFLIMLINIMGAKTAAILQTVLTCIIGGAGILLIVLLVIVLFIAASCVKIVPQASAYVVESLGKYKGTWATGLHFKVPFIERVAIRVNLKEQVVDFPPQPVITKDNVTMQIDTVVFFQITDPKLFAYGVVNPLMAIENLTATTLRNIIGDLELDETLTSREIINTKMQAALDIATDPWGIKVNRVELKNIMPPAAIQEAMEKQMKAERERREAILIAEGEKKSTILVAEGKKQSAILDAEAEKQAAILRAEAEKEKRIREAEGQAEAILKVQQANADGIRAIKEAGADDAVLTLKSLEALGVLANGKATKIVVPSDLQGLASLATTFKGIVEEQKVPAGKEVQK